MTIYSTSNFLMGHPIEKLRRSKIAELHNKIADFKALKF